MRLRRAYARCEYRVLLEPALRLRAGTYDAAAERRMQVECGLQHRWAVLTPCNPGSKRLNGLQNRRRLRALRRSLLAMRLSHTAALNSDPDGRWPDEPGFLLLDPTLKTLLGLAREFRQNAILYGEVGEPPRLIWL